MIIRIEYTCRRLVGYDSQRMGKDNAKREKYKAKTQDLSVSMQKDTPQWR